MKRLLFAGGTSALFALLVLSPSAHAVDYEPCSGCDAWNHHSAFYETFLSTTPDCLVDTRVKGTNKFERDGATNWKVASWDIPSYACVQQIAQAFEAEYPTRVKVIDIGVTPGDANDPSDPDWIKSPKRITAIRIGTDDYFPPGHERAGKPKPVVLYDAAVHGNERETTRILLDWMDYLLNPDNEYIEDGNGVPVAQRRGYPGAPDDFTFTKMRDERIIWIVPSVNPDGLNRRGDNGNNVDLAKNFMWGWKNKSDAGPHPLSEAESIALARFAEMILPSVHLHMHGWTLALPGVSKISYNGHDFLEGYHEVESDGTEHIYQQMQNTDSLYQVAPNDWIPNAREKMEHLRVARPGWDPDDAANKKGFPRLDAVQYTCRDTKHCNTTFGVSLPALAEAEQETNMMAWVPNVNNKEVVERHLGERFYGPYEYGEDGTGTPYDTYAHYTGDRDELWKKLGYIDGAPGQVFGHMAASVGTLSFLYEIPRFDNDTDAFTSNPFVSVNTPYAHFLDEAKNSTSGSFIWGIHRDEEIIQMLIRDSFYPMNRLVLDAANPIPETIAHNDPLERENDVAISALKMTRDGCDMDYTATYEQTPSSIFTPRKGYFGRRDVACTATNYGDETSGQFSIEMHILKDGTEVVEPHACNIGDAGLGVGASQTCTLSEVNFVQNGRYQVICEVTASDLDAVEAESHVLVQEKHLGCKTMADLPIFSTPAELEAVVPTCVWDSTNNKWDAVFHTNNRRVALFDAVLNQYAVCDFEPWDDRIDMNGDVACVTNSDCDDGVPCTNDTCVDSICEYNAVDAEYEAETMTHTTGDIYPDGWNIWDENGYISFEHTFDGGVRQMVVTAAAEEGAGWPDMFITVGGVPLPVTTVTSEVWDDYLYTFNAPTGSAEVRIYFTNDYYEPPVDRNLLIDKVTMPCDDGKIDLLVTSINVFDDWGAGYCANLEITNNGTSPTTDWSVVIDSQDSDIYEFWNTTYIDGTGQHTIGTVGWNATIEPGSTYITTGFCAERLGSDATVPIVISDELMY